MERRIAHPVGALRLWTGRCRASKRIIEIVGNQWGEADYLALAETYPNGVPETPLNIGNLMNRCLNVCASIHAQIITSEIVGRK